MNIYSEKLKDPRWQRKRLEVFNRYRFACARCGDGITQLHVHHRYYEKGLAPWDYPDSALICLCRRCHERISDILKAIGILADQPYMLELLELLPEMTDLMAIEVWSFCQGFIDQPKASKA